MASAMVTVNDSANQQPIAGAQYFGTENAYLNGQLNGSWPINGVTDANGVATLDDNLTQDSWGNTWTYTFNVQWQANGFASSNANYKTGGITGDVMFPSTTMNPISPGGGGGGPSGSGTVALTAPTIDWTGYITYIIIAVIVIGVILVAIHYRKQIFGGAKKAASGVAKYAKAGATAGMG